MSQLYSSCACRVPLNCSFWVEYVLQFRGLIHWGITQLTNYLTKKLSEKKLFLTVLQTSWFDPEPSMTFRSRDTKFPFTRLRAKRAWSKTPSYH